MPDMTQDAGVCLPSGSGRRVGRKGLQDGVRLE